MRVADPRRSKGKRGGIRVIYLHIDEVDQIHPVTIHGKDQKDDLSVMAGSRHGVAIAQWRKSANPYRTMSAGRTNKDQRVDRGTELRLGLGGCREPR
jgi:hypothetical protein